MSYQAWSETIPDEYLNLQLGYKQWAICTAVIVIIYLFLIHCPVIHEFFDLSWKIPLAVYFLAPVVELFGLWLFYHNKIKKYQAIFFILAASVFLEMSFALMIRHASPFGGAIIAVLFIFSATFHGFAYRASSSNPYMPLGTAIALLIPAIGVTSMPHLAIFAILFISSIGCSLMCGAYAVAGDKDRAENERLKLAIQAQMLTAETTRADRLTEVIRELGAWAHDMKNHLSSVDGCMIMLSPPPDLPQLSQTEEQKEHLFQTIKQHHRDLRAGLDKSGKIIQALKTEEQKMDAFPLAPTIHQILNHIGCRFPRIAIDCQIDQDLPGEIKLYGGQLTFHRIIENIVINACEGDGTNSATKIFVELHHLKDEKAIRISITDNGPGFSAEQLSRPIQTFQTTKETGTGLGLYSTERLVLAHCGKLIRANAPDSGAIVSLTLPVVATSTDDFQTEPTGFPQISGVTAHTGGTPVSSTS